MWFIVTFDIVTGRALGRITSRNTSYPSVLTHLESWLKVQGLYHHVSYTAHVGSFWIVKEKQGQKHWSQKLVCRKILLIINTKQIKQRFYGFISPWLGKQKFTSVSLTIKDIPTLPPEKKKKKNYVSIKNDKNQNV